MNVKLSRSLPFGGRYDTEEGRLLVAFRDPDKCVTVTLQNEQYDEVKVQVEDI